MKSAIYDFYEVVKVVTSRSELTEINGSEGAVLGMAQNDHGDWLYAVHILGSDEGWDVMENELVSTGKMMSREDFYDGESVVVEVDPITGEGKLKS
ncbi:MAG: hypothetical protein ACI9SP_002624 [Arenicella sp.]|jgi:hypothetical protein